MIPLGVLGGGHVPDGFSPLSLTNLNLWLDSSDLPDGPVALWPDKSGLGNHATQTSLSQQPVRAPEGVVFDKYNYNSMDSPAPSTGGPQCIFAVAAPGNTSDAVVVGGTTNFAFTVGFNSQRPEAEVWAMSATYARSTYTKPLNTLVAIAAIHDYNANVNRIVTDVSPGISVASSTRAGQTSGSQTTRIADQGTAFISSNKFTGTIAEIVKCSSVPSESEIVSMMNYFATKWGTNPF